jgi:hypothetical protein
MSQPKAVYGPIFGNATQSLFQKTKTIIPNKPNQTISIIEIANLSEEFHDEEDDELSAIDVM